MWGRNSKGRRWVEHFEPAPQNPSDILPAAEDLDIESGIMTRDEMRMTIRQLKSGKAAEPHGIPCKAPKADTKTTV